MGPTDNTNKKRSRSNSVTPDNKEPLSKKHKSAEIEASETMLSIIPSSNAPTPTNQAPTPTNQAPTPPTPAIVSPHNLFFASIALPSNATGNSSSSHIIPPAPGSDSFSSSSSAYSTSSSSSSDCSSSDDDDDYMDSSSSSSSADSSSSSSLSGHSSIDDDDMEFIDEINCLDKIRDILTHVHIAYGNMCDCRPGMRRSNPISAASSKDTFLQHADQALLILNKEIPRILVCRENYMDCVLHYKAYESKKGEKCYDPEYPTPSGRILLKLLRVTSAADLLLTCIQDELEDTLLNQQPSPKEGSFDSLRKIFAPFLTAQGFYSVKDTTTGKTVPVDPLRAFTELDTYTYDEGKQKLEQFLTACDLGNSFKLSEFFVLNEEIISQQDFLTENPLIKLNETIKYDATKYKELYKVYYKQGNGVEEILTARLQPILLPRPKPGSTSSSQLLTAKTPDDVIARLLGAHIDKNLAMFLLPRIRDNHSQWKADYEAQLQSNAQHSFSP